ncbi:MAG: hypothetical protein V4543_14205 [Bacteroidota bacterium]
MRILKTALIIFCSIICLAGIWLSATEKPLVLDFSDKDEPETGINRLGTKVRPLKNLDFNNGKWVAYIILKPEDVLANENLPLSLVSTDTSLLKQMQSSWTFTYTGADVATLDSMIIIT